MLLVTGVGGLLGTTFALRARERSADVVAAYHRRPVDLPGVRAVEGDLADAKVARDVIEAVRPDVIVHCAALAEVDRCEDEPAKAHRANAEMPRHVARAAAGVGARMVHISTDSVFDGERGDYAEDDAVGPINVYSRTKLDGERAVRDELGERALIVRTDIYGWNAQPKEGLAEWILHRLEAGAVVPGFTDLTSTPISASDLSVAILDAIAAGLSGSYHIAGAEACPKYDFALRLAEVFDLDRTLVHPASVGDAGLRARRPRDLSLSTRKISRDLGREMPDVRSGLIGLRQAREGGEAEALRRYVTRR